MSGEYYETLLHDNVLKEADSFIKSLHIDFKDPRRKENLIAVLHKMQELIGYLPDEIQAYVARKLHLNLAEVSGVISFYNFFTITPKGKHRVNVCMGTACFVRGADNVLTAVEKCVGVKAGQLTADGEISLDIVRCVGACGLAPIVLIDGDTHGKAEPKDMANALAPVMKG
jgi:NADH:ubiquinone oxidoreductase subunit E